MHVFRWLAWVPIVAMGSCLKPTEVELVITTDVPCSDLNGVTISVGPLGESLESAPPSATATCRDGKIGSIVLVPAASLDQGVGIRVVAGFRGSVDQCRPPYGPKCIVARRALRYIPHTPLTLPIQLSATCAGIPCEANFTCDNGRCVPAKVDGNKCVGNATDCQPGPGGWADCGDMSVFAKGSPWPMTGGCPTQIRRTPYAAATKPRFLWRLPRKLAMPIGSEPAIRADGTILFGGMDGYLYAYVGKTGAPAAAPLDLAVTIPGGGIGGNGALGADGTLTISGGERVWGVNASLTSALWTYPLGSSDSSIGPGQISYLIVVDKGMAFLIGMSPAGAELIRTPLKTPAAGYAAPTVEPDGTVYLETGDGFVHAIDTLTNPTNPRWSTKVGTCTPQILFSFCTSTIASTNGKLFLISAQQPAQPLLIALDAATGQPLPGWQHPVSKLAFPVIGTDGTVYASSLTAVQAFDPASGAMLWELPLGGVASSSVLDGTGALISVVVGGPLDGRLVAIDTTTHAVRWDVDAYKGTTVVIGGDGSVLMDTSDGDLVVLGY